MNGLPSGTVTFLLTDVEGSTAAWERDADATRAAMASLDRLVDEVVPGHAGVVVKPRGEGDSHFCVFTAATDAVAAGVELLRQLVGGPTSVRMAVHTGEADLHDGDYYGRTVNRAARLRAAGHGGQLLISEVSAALVRDRLSADLSLRDLGVHRLKDLSSPESIYEVVHFDLPSVTRPLATLDIRRNNLPLQLTPLIGRDETVIDVLNLLTTQRLVTLVALGGTGKTRLGLQVAADASGNHPGGVWYAELTPLHQSEQVPDAILAAVGGPSDAADSLVEAADWIAARELLLVLDNCEHLLDAVASAVTHLLARCPGLKVLATSRQPLEVPGEAVFRVPPLGLPRPDDDVLEIAGAPAVRLFLERGRAVDPALELDDENAKAVAQLCAGLDGLPLAIELAASRLKILDPQQILDRLNDRLALVDGASRSATNRTVRAAMEWSHDLLKPEEAVLLRRLAIFEGSVDLAAVEAVCGEGLEDIAGGLSRLVDHSLVTVDAARYGRRYRLLDLVRAFAGEFLDASGERDAMDAARARWADDYAERVRPVAEDALKARAEFLQSQPDIEAALGWRERSDLQNLADSVLAICGTWEVLDRWTLAARWTNRALEADVPAEPHQRLKLLLLDAGLSFARWEFREGIRLGEEALALAEELGDVVGQEDAHNQIACSTWRSGDLERAHSHNERALELARDRPGGDRMASTSANNLGLVATWRGDLAEAERWFKLSLEFSARFGQSAHGYWRLGQNAAARGRPDEASRLFESAIVTGRAEGWTMGVAYAESSLGRLLAAQGDYGSAEVHFLAANAAASEAGDESVSSHALLDAARVAALQGKESESQALTARAFAELAGEPVRQVVVVDGAIYDAIDAGVPDVAYDLSRRLLEVTLRDGTAKGAAWTTFLLATSSFEVGRHDEARQLAAQARAKFVTLGDVDVGSESAARRIEQCDELLAKIDSRAQTSSLS